MTHAPPVQAPVQAAPAAAPVLSVNNYSGIRPGGIYLSGDAGYIITNITWADWGPNTATGTGTSSIQGCVPSCAEGSETPVTTTVVLSGVQGGRFTHYSSTRNGDTTSGPVSEIQGAAQVSGANVPARLAPGPTQATGGNCGGGITADAATSCPFAQAVARAYQGPGSDSEQVTSPVTGQTYSMSYTEDPSPSGGGTITATGGSNISVTFSWDY